MFARLFSGFGQKEKAYRLYGKLVSQARNPIFYTELGVPDDLDGRFDMILLHLFILDRRLERDGKKAEKLRRMLQEALIADMDRSLREMGVGDMSIGKEVKKMGAAWFGRLKAYTAALVSDAPKPALTTAIAKNLYKQEDDAPFASSIADYCLEALQKLGGVDLAELTDLKFEFPCLKPSKGN